MPAIVELGGSESGVERRKAVCSQCVCGVDKEDGAVVSVTGRLRPSSKPTSNHTTKAWTVMFFCAGLLLLLEEDEVVVVDDEEEEDDEDDDDDDEEEEEAGVAVPTVMMKSETQSRSDSFTVLRSNT